MYANAINCIILIPKLEEYIDCFVVLFSSKIEKIVWFSFSKDWYFESIFPSKIELFQLKFSKNILVSTNINKVTNGHLFLVFRKPESIKIPVKINT